MNTVAELVEKFGGPTKFGRACGFEINPAARGGDMSRRGSIPVSYWPRLIAAAADLGIEGLTYEVLAKAHAKNGDLSAPALSQTEAAE